MMDFIHIRDTLFLVLKKERTDNINFSPEALESIKEFILSVDKTYNNIVESIKKSKC